MLFRSVSQSRYTGICTIIGAKSFHGPVRDGKGWCQLAIPTFTQGSALSSARSRFTVLFGMGRGGTNLLLSSGSEYSTKDYREEYRIDFNHTYVVKHGVEVTGFNPNAQLLNIMGTTTPFSSFLSVVPWFWAVNYFVNINAMISNFEIRYPGVTIGSSYTTVLHKVKYQGYTRYYAGGWQGYTNTATSFYDGDFVYMRRKINNGVPKYKLHFGVPALGSSSFANLFSAIALTMKGKAK